MRARRAGGGRGGAAAGKARGAKRDARAGEGAQEGEFRYLKSLRTAVHVFQGPMTADGILSEAEAAAIFRNLGTIRSTHAKLQALLQRAAEEETVSSAVVIMSSGLQKCVRGGAGRGGVVCVRGGS